MLSLFLYILYALQIRAALASPAQPVSTNQDGRIISPEVFESLEELARIVDITYCVGSTGVWKPFKCLSRCNEFPGFELVTSWNTGILLSDSCGYIALSHPPHKKRIVVAFRGTYSIANTIADLSTGHAEYAPYPADGGPDFACPSGEKNVHHKTPPPSPPPQTLLSSHDPITSSTAEKCNNCTVHSGFATSWRNTRCVILPHVQAAMAQYPDYELTLVGHSLGGAVAALAALEFQSRGWKPHVTTFGEPRIGNFDLNRFLDARFNLSGSDNSTEGTNFEDARYRRVTHASDPVPLLPLSEWGYTMHAGEIFISKVSLPPSRSDIRFCRGDADLDCINGGAHTRDAIVAAVKNLTAFMKNEDRTSERQDSVFDIVDSAGKQSGNGVGKRGEETDRLAPWQLFVAHRDYFWRLGLCVPGGDPWNWRRPGYGHVDDEDHELRL